MFYFYQWVARRTPPILSMRSLIGGIISRVLSSWAHICIILRRSPSLAKLKFPSEFENNIIDSNIYYTMLKGQYSSHLFCTYTLVDTGFFQCVLSFLAKLNVVFLNLLRSTLSYNRQIIKQSRLSAINLNLTLSTVLINSTYRLGTDVKPD